ncbi:MAG: putative Tic20 family protein [Planctomycetota bacterium]|jgi:uncharacterized Tic20 family protein
MTTADPSSEFVNRPWMDGDFETPKTTVSVNRNWLIASHLLPLALWIVYPFGSAVVVPLLIWQLKAKAEDNQEIAKHAVESLNLQINLTLLCIVLSITIIGLVAVPFVMIAGIVLPIIASYKAYHGTEYQYPWIKRLVKV